MHRSRISLLLLLALLLSFALPAAAADEPALRIEAPAAVQAGERFTVRVLLDGNPGLCAVQFTLRYDSAALTCTSCEAGELLGKALTAANPAAPGGAAIAAVSTKPCTGDGALGVYEFLAVSDGAPALTLTGVTLAGADGTPLAVTLPASAEQPVFDDISGSFAVSYIEEAAVRGLIRGYNGHYRPADAMTRGECVTILYRAMGSPAVTKPATFTDLTRDYYRDAIAWAEQNGVVNGVGNGKFNPGGQVTRAQLAALLFRLSGGQSGPEALLSEVYRAQFEDASAVPAYARPAIYWAVYNEIYCGTDTPEPGAALAPNQPATRAQIAVMIVRTLDLAAEKENTP